MMLVFMFCCYCEGMEKIPIDRNPSVFCHVPHGLNYALTCNKSMGSIDQFVGNCHRRLGSQIYSKHNKFRID